MMVAIIPFDHTNPLYRIGPEQDGQRWELGQSN